MAERTSRFFFAVGVCVEFLCSLIHIKLNYTEVGEVGVSGVIGRGQGRMVEAVQGESARRTGA